MGLRYCSVKDCRSADLGGLLLPDGHETMTLTRMADVLSEQNEDGTLRESGFRDEWVARNTLCAEHGEELDAGRLQKCCTCGRLVAGDSPPGELNECVCADCSASYLPGEQPGTRLNRPPFVGVSSGPPDISWDIVDGLPMEAVSYFNKPGRSWFDRLARSGVKWNWRSQPRGFAYVRIWSSPNRPPRYATLAIPDERDRNRLAVDLSINDISEGDRPPFYKDEILLVYRRPSGLGKRFSVPRIAEYEYDYSNRIGLSTWLSNGGGPLPPADVVSTLAGGLSIRVKR